MSILFFTDLDDTLIYTTRKINNERKNIKAAYKENGDLSSSMYLDEFLLIKHLLKHGVRIIPTTARNFKSYKRTIFYKNKKINTAILNFGATIMHKDTIDETWNKKIQNNYSSIDSMEVIKDKLIKLLPQDCIVKNIDTYYVSIFNKEHCTTMQKEIKKTLKKFLKKNKMFYMHNSQYTFSILPYFLNKSAAVKYILEKEKPFLSFGAGDNQNDLDFMNLTNFRIIPNHKNVNIKIK